MINILSSILAIIFMICLVGLLFLWAGITGTLMIEAMENEGLVRTFTYWGMGFGGVLGVIAIWLHEKGKRNG